MHDRMLLITFLKTATDG